MLTTTYSIFGSLCALRFPLCRRKRAHAAKSDISTVFLCIFSLGEEKNAHKAPAETMQVRRVHPRARQRRTAAAAESCIQPQSASTARLCALSAFAIISMRTPANECHRIGVATGSRCPSAKGNARPKHLVRRKRANREENNRIRPALSLAH